MNANYLISEARQQQWPMAKNSLSYILGISEPENHRIGNAGRDHSGHLVQPPCSSRVTPKHMAQDYIQMISEYLQ